MLTPLATDLWEFDAPMTILGMALGHRMTVARLPDRSLWLHSPVSCAGDLLAHLETLGPIGHIVAPNGAHDTYLEGWFGSCAKTRFHAPAALFHGRPDLHFTDRLTGTPDPAWADVFDQHVIGGMPRVGEVVFLHRASRTLIIADLAFNLGPDMPLLSRVILRLNGCYCKFGASRLFRAFIKDRAAFRASLDHILAWDFDRVVVSHGRNLETGGKETLRAAFAFF